MVGNESGGLLVRAEPLELAQEVCRRIAEVSIVDGALLLDAAPAWAWAINTVLVMKGVRVSELTERSSERTAARKEGRRR